MKFIIYTLLYSFFAKNFIANCYNILPTDDNQNITSLVNLQSETPSKGIEKLKVINEGAPVLPNVPESSSTKGDLLLSLDNDFGHMKINSIKPRKGANMNSSEELTVGSKLLEQNINNLTKIDEYVHTKESLKNVYKASNDSLRVNATKFINVTTHNKPLVLSYEALATLNNLSNKGLNSNALEKNLASKNSYYSQPKFVILIVMSMLILPIFVIVAFMGFKKGKEAWKNRHYKRVDFLLDGMYKD